MAETWSRRRLGVVRLPEPPGLVIPRQTSTTCTSMSIAGSTLLMTSFSLWNLHRAGQSPARVPPPTPRWSPPYELPPHERNTRPSQVTVPYRGRRRRCLDCVPASHYPSPSFTSLGSLALSTCVSLPTFLLHHRLPTCPSIYLPISTCVICILARSHIRRVRPQ